MQTGQTPTTYFLWCSASPSLECTYLSESHAQTSSIPRPVRPWYQQPKGLDWMVVKDMSHRVWNATAHNVKQIIIFAATSHRRLEASQFNAFSWNEACRQTRWLSYCVELWLFDVSYQFMFSKFLVRLWSLKKNTVSWMLLPHCWNINIHTIHYFVDLFSETGGTDLSRLLLVKFFWRGKNTPSSPKNMLEGQSLEGNNPVWWLVIAFSKRSGIYTYCYSKYHHTFLSPMQ